MKKLILLFTMFLSMQTAFSQCTTGTSIGTLTVTALWQTVPVVAGVPAYRTFAAIGGGSYTFTYCQGGGSYTGDPYLTISDNTPIAQTQNDDFCGLGSQITWTCPTSGTYRIYFSGCCPCSNAPNATCAYRMNPPVNDPCTSALVAFVPSVITGNTTYATADVAPSCTTTDGTGGGVWYTFMGNGNQITASLCSSTFDTRIRVFTGSCSSLTCVTGNDDFCGLQSQVTWCSANGTNYYILVHGTGAGMGDFTLTMSEVVPIAPTITQSAFSYCGSGSITITASGSTAYTWSPPSGLNTTTGPVVIASPAVTTTYTVAITDVATGCPAYANATVTVNPIPVMTASASNPVICGGGNSTLTATGASTYLWMPGNLTGSSVVVSPISNTTYTVTGTSTFGCTNTTTVIVTSNPLPIVNATSSSPDVCIGSFVTLNSAGALTYNWMPGNLSNPTPNVTPSVTTTYTLTGTDGNGCIGTDTLTMIVNPLPTITATASPDTVCTGNADTLTAAGGTTYVWSSGGTDTTEIVFPSTLTTYTVTGTDTNGCVSSGTVTVFALLSGPVTATAAYPTICPGSNNILNAIGAPNYIWQPGNLTGSQVTVSPAVTTTYTVTGYSTNGCVKIDSVTVLVNSSPTVSASSSISTMCAGNPTVLTGTGATSYNWNPGNLSGNPVTVNPTVSTTYTATGTDANGCTDTALVAITIFPAPNVVATSVPPVSCSGNPVTISATGANSYAWMPGSLTGTSITVTPATATTYTVVGTDSNGCTDSYQINIAVVSSANLIVYSAQTNVCSNDQGVMLFGIPSGGTWSGPGVSGNSFNPTTAGPGTHVLTYTLVDQYGCTSTATTNIVVNACVGIAEQSGLSGVSFYPNPNDGSFTINVASENISEMKMEVIDLQGRVVYAEMLNGINSGYAKTIAVNNLANGAYYLRFSSNNSSSIQKLIIQR